ncbi:hypothetical protein WMY93_002326 [Mugilogobius chulae]|uniref:Tissue factor pathway inhibitor n=1 Tax=Mugilogobius chulae TaxID=88201 RepID=A0AAW0PVD3_9GOBI
MIHKCVLLCALLCVLSAARSEARRSHRNGGGHFQSERFIFREQCALKEESGPCKAIKPRYFFNIDSGRCEMFEFGGCGGNDNNFLTKEECEETCVVSEDKDPCQLPEAPGPCRGLVSRFLYDPEIQSCRHFFYGGCFGNANNFRSMDECRSRCQNTDKSEQTTSPPKMDHQELQTHAVRRMMPLESVAVTAEPIAAAQTDNNTTTSEHYSKVSSPEECQLSVDPGDCDGAERRFFYNTTTRRCQSFTYSGCGGNKNNFLHRRSCYRKCGHRFKDHTMMFGGKMIRIRRKNLDKFKQVSV